MKNKKILLTGYSGFIGSNVLHYLKDRMEITLLGRKPLEDFEFHAASFISGESYSQAMEGVDVVIHCAARVHVMDDRSPNPLQDYREVNTYGTVNLARQAAKNGVKRFIFVSTIKVNGDVTSEGKPYGPDDECFPKDPYGISKYEAEVELHKISQETGLDVVIIRPPLVYGPGVKGNFGALIKFIKSGFPLPFGTITNNRRSFVSVDNLIHLISTCIDHPNASNQIFLVSDDQDISTTDLLKKLALKLNIKSRLIPIPIFVLKLMFTLIRKPTISNRLLGSLQVDITKTKHMLDWQPPHESFEYLEVKTNSSSEI